MRVFRVIGVVMGALFALVGLLAIVAAAIRHRPGAGAAYGMGVVFILFGGLIVTMLLVQGRAVRAARARIRQAVGDIAARAFDAPPRVDEAYDGAWLLGPFGGMSTLYDGVNFTAAEGASRGAHLVVASHASIAGRQMFEVCHVYSYIAVDAPSGGAFTLYERGADTKIFSAVAGSRDAPLGDPAFDAAFLCSAEPTIAARIFDAELRARLVELRAQVARVSQDFGVGRMVISRGPTRLVLRWPGELSVDFALKLRDLLVDMRAKVAAAGG